MQKGDVTVEVLVKRAAIRFCKTALSSFAETAWLHLSTCTRLWWPNRPYLGKIVTLHHTLILAGQSIYIAFLNGLLVFYFICCIKKYFQILLFWRFPGSKNHLKSCIFFRCMMTTMEEQIYCFCQIPGSKKHWEENIFSIFGFEKCL